MIVEEGVMKKWLITLRHVSIFLFADALNFTVEKDIQMVEQALSSSLSFSPLFLIIRSNVFRDKTSSELRAKAEIASGELEEARSFCQKERESTDA